MVPLVVLKRWVEVEELLEVGKCPWAGQREKEWSWWMKMREEEAQKQQRSSLFGWRKIQSVDPPSCG